MKNKLKSFGKKIVSLVTASIITINLFPILNIPFVKLLKTDAKDPASESGKNNFFTSALNYKKLFRITATAYIHL